MLSLSEGVLKGVVFDPKLQRNGKFNGVIYFCHIRGAVEWHSLSELNISNLRTKSSDLLPYLFLCFPFMLHTDHKAELLSITEYVMSTLSFVCLTNVCVLAVPPHTL